MIRNNGVIVQTDGLINVTSAARFILNGVDPQAIEDIRLYLQKESWRVVLQDPNKIQEHGLLFVSASVNVLIGERKCEIFAASVMENTKRLDIDSKLIVSHHAYLGTEEEIDTLAKYVSQQSV